MSSCKKILLAKNSPRLNMREVADSCGVALGSIYNYFPSKDDLLVAAVADIWHDIFHADQPCPTDLSFSAYVSWIFESIQNGADDYSHFFALHSVIISESAKKDGGMIMSSYFNHIKSGLLEALKRDTKVKSAAFTDNFSMEEMVDFVFSSLLTLLRQEKNDCHILVELINRGIYE